MTDAKIDSEFAVDDIGGGRFVRVRSRRLDADNAERLKQVLKGGDEAPNTAVDMGEVEFVDSSGMGALLSGVRALSSRGKVFGLIGLREQPQKLLRLLRLERVLPSYKDEEAFLSSSVERPAAVSRPESAVSRPESEDCVFDALQHLVEQHVVLTEEIFGPVSEEMRERIEASVHKRMILDHKTAPKLVEEMKGIWSELERRKVLNAMAGGINHCLNNLLVPIMGEAHLLGTRLQDPELLESVAAIEGAAVRIAKLVRRLQAFSEPRTKASDEAADLNQVIREAADLTRVFWKEQAQRDGRNLQMDLQLREIPLVRGSARDIREAVSGLIINSVEAVGQAGTILIRTLQRGGKGVVEISDDGGGMPEEVHGKVVQPFYTTKGMPHAGLGLSLAAEIASRFGGKLTVRSRPGEGTMIEMTFRQGAGASLPERPRVRPGRAALRILLVDDDETVRRAMARMLGREGHEVVVASDGGSALALLEGGRFHGVLTDWSMPGMDGLALARAVKESRPEMPVVLFTGWETGKLDAARAEGWLDAILSKPVRVEELQGVLARWAPR